MYTNLDNDVLLLGPVDDYDKLQEEEGSHLSTSKSYTSFISTDNSIWLLAIEDNSLKVNKIADNWFTVNYITPELLGFTEYFDKTLGKLYIYSSTMTYYRTKTYIFSVDLQTLQVERGRYDWSVVNGNKEVIFPGVGKVISNWMNTPLTSVKFLECDFPVSSDCTIGVYGLSKHDDIWITPTTPVIDTTFLNLIISSMFTMDSAEAELASMRDYSVESMKLAMTKALYSGTMQLFPIQLSCVKDELYISGDDWLSTKYGKYVLRPLVHLHNIGLIWSIPYVPLSMYDYSLGYTSLISAMSDMSIADMWYSSLSNTIQVLYDFAPTDINTGYANPARQETDLSSAHSQLLHMFDTPTHPFVDVIAGENETFILYIGKDQLQENVLWLWDSFDKKSGPSKAQILYTKTVQPEEYGIFEGLAFGKVYFYGFEDDGNMRRASKSSVIFDTFTVMLYPQGYTPTNEWNYGDLTRFSSDIFWSRRNSDCCNFDGCSMSSNAVLGVMSPNNQILELAPTDKSFIFSMSSTSLLSDLDSRILDAIHATISSNQNKLDLHVPIYIVTNIYHDWAEQPINYLPQSLKPEGIAMPYIVLSPHGERVFLSHYNRGRVEAYTVFYKQRKPFTQYLLQYDCYVEISDVDGLSDLFNFIHTIGIPPESVHFKGSLFTKSGLTCSVEYNNQMNDFVLKLTKPVMITTTGLKVLYSRDYTDFGSFSKIYFDKDENRIFTHTATEGVVYELNKQKAITFPLELYQEQQDDQGNKTKVSVPIRTVANMKKFAQIMKKWIPQEDDQQNQSN